MASSRTNKRSKWAIDLMYRIWDEHNSQWVFYRSRTIWIAKRAAERVRTLMIKQGRNPETLSVERVFVTLRAAE